MRLAGGLESLMHVSERRSFPYYSDRSEPLRDEPASHRLSPEGSRMRTSVDFASLLHALKPEGRFEPEEGISHVRVG